MFFFFIFIFHPGLSTENPRMDWTGTNLDRLHLESIFVHSQEIPKVPIRQVFFFLNVFSTFWKTDEKYGTMRTGFGH